MKLDEKTRLFVEWYINYPHTKESWEKNRSPKLNVTYETGMKYRYEPDVVSQIKEYYKNQAMYDMLDVYNKMKDNALKGDVQSAKFLMDFNKANFFTDSKSEINDLLNSIKGV